MYQWPLRVVARINFNDYHLLQDVDVGPLGVLPVGLIAATTKAREDIDGGPRWGAARRSSSGHHRS
jgi:hypothetical protein